MRRHLVVANQTLGGEQLTAKLAECIDAGPSRFYLVVPVTNTEGSDRWFTGGLEGVLPGAYRIARTLAGARLEHELDRLREAGAEADGAGPKARARRRSPRPGPKARARRRGLTPALSWPGSRPTRPPRRRQPGPRR
jgi:hypothetical protein